MKNVKTLTSASRHKIAKLVQNYLIEKNISRKSFVTLIGRGKSTIDHFFSGTFSETLLARIELKLGMSLRESSNVAPTEWGGYSRESVELYAGTYLTLRRNFQSPTEIWAYVTRIEWSNVEKAFVFGGKVKHAAGTIGYGLTFREERRIDPKYTHSGQVWIPTGNYMYLVSAYGDGRLRAAIVSRPGGDARLMGIQLTQFNPKRAAFAPAASPVALIKRDNIDDNELGAIDRMHFRYEEYKNVLDEAIDSVVFAGR